MSEGYISGNKQTVSATVEYEGSTEFRLKAALLKIEQLKTVIEELEQDRDYHEHRCDDLESDIIELEDQRDALKKEIKEEKVGHGLSIDTSRKLELLPEKQLAAKDAQLKVAIEALKWYANGYHLATDMTGKQLQCETGIKARETLKQLGVENV